MKQNSESTFMQKLFGGCIAFVICMSIAVYRINGEFENKIYYKIHDYGQSVTVESCERSCSGDIIIPTQVRINNKTYSVTGIGGCAFEDCRYLTSIDIPEGVTSIGNNPFRDCSSLTSMIVSADNHIYDSREGCNAIIETETNTLIAGCQNTVIPSSVTSIGDHAFDGCSSLTSIVIPSSVTSIGDHAFDGCYSLTSIDIPAGVTSIGQSAFYLCSSLTSMTVSADNHVYDSRESCNAIIETETNTLIAGCQNTVIPEGVTSIGDYAFFGCSSLASIDIPEGVTSIGDDAFFGCDSLASVDIPEGVTSIGGCAFDGCTSLASIDIPAGVTSIEGYAFSDCSSLASVDIPSGVTSIGDRAFDGCTSLASIDIPAGVTSIGSCAFDGCTSLTTVICRAKKVPAFDWHAFTRTPIDKATLYVPASSINAYKAADQWKDFKAILPLEDYQSNTE